MVQSKSSKSCLFLMELILSIFFFTISSTVCIQLFVKAHLIGIETKELHNSVLWTQNVAEVYLACNGSLEEMVPFFIDATLEDNLLHIPESITGIDTNYAIQVTNTSKSNSTLITGSILLINEDTMEILNTMEIKKHITIRSKVNE